MTSESSTATRKKTESAEYLRKVLVEELGQKQNKGVAFKDFLPGADAWNAFQTFIERYKDEAANNNDQDFARFVELLNQYQTIALKCMALTQEDPLLRAAAIYEILSSNYKTIILLVDYANRVLEKYPNKDISVTDETINRLDLPLSGITNQLIQTSTKYHLLMQQVIKFAPDGSPESIQANRLLVDFSAFGSSMNEFTRSLEKVDAVQDLQGGRLTRAATVMNTTTLDAIRKRLNSSAGDSVSTVQINQKLDQVRRDLTAYLENDNVPPEKTAQLITRVMETRDDLKRKLTAKIKKSEQQRAGGGEQNSETRLLSADLEAYAAQLKLSDTERTFVRQLSLSETELKDVMQLMKNMNTLLDFLRVLQKNPIYIPENEIDFEKLVMPANAETVVAEQVVTQQAAPVVDKSSAPEAVNSAVTATPGGPESIVAPAAPATTAAATPASPPAATVAVTPTLSPAETRTPLFTAASMTALYKDTAARISSLTRLATKQAKLEKEGVIEARLQNAARDVIYKKYTTANTDAVSTDQEVVAQLEFLTTVASNAIKQNFKGEAQAQKLAALVAMKQDYISRIATQTDDNQLYTEMLQDLLPLVFTPEQQANASQQFEKLFMEEVDRQRQPDIVHDMGNQQINAQTVENESNVVFDSVSANTAEGIRTQSIVVRAGSVEADSINRELQAMATAFATAQQETLKDGDVITLPVTYNSFTPILERNTSRVDQVLALFGINNSKEARQQKLHQEQLTQYDGKTASIKLGDKTIQVQYAVSQWNFPAGLSEKKPFGLLRMLGVNAADFISGEHDAINAQAMDTYCQQQQASLASRNIAEPLASALTTLFDSRKTLSDTERNEKINLARTQAQELLASTAPTEREKITHLQQALYVLDVMEQFYSGAYKQSSHDMYMFSAMISRSSEMAGVMQALHTESRSQKTTDTRRAYDAVMIQAETDPERKNKPLVSSDATHKEYVESRITLVQQRKASAAVIGANFWKLIKPGIKAIAQKMGFPQESQRPREEAKKLLTYETVSNTFLRAALVDAQLHNIGKGQNAIVLDEQQIAKINALFPETIIPSQDFSAKYQSFLEIAGNIPDLRVDVMHALAVHNIQASNQEAFSLPKSKSENVNMTTLNDIVTKLHAAKPPQEAKVKVTASQLGIAAQKLRSDIDALTELRDKFQVNGLDEASLARFVDPEKAKAVVSMHHDISARLEALNSKLSTVTGLQGQMSTLSENVLSNSQLLAPQAKSSGRALPPTPHRRPAPAQPATAPAAAPAVPAPDRTEPRRLSPSRAG